MCWCRGTWKVAAQHLDYANKHRGYDYEPDDVSDRSVTLVVNKILGNLDAAVDNLLDSVKCYHVETPTRWYAAYTID